MSKNKGCAGCNQTPSNSNANVILMLKNLFPLLKQDYRELKENEIEKEEVFIELFPEKNKIDLGLLKAVHEYQKLKRAFK